MYPSLFCSNSVSPQMDLTMSCSSLSLLFLIFSLHIHFLVPASGYFPPHEDCVPHRCGDQEISYPFRHIEQPNYCGYPGYELSCDGDNLTLSMESLEYRVIHMNMSTRILEVERMDLSEDLCLGAPLNTILNFSLFDYTSSDLNYTLFYGCELPAIVPYWFYCHTHGHGYFAPHVDSPIPLPDPCNFGILVPILRSEAPGPLLPSKDDGHNATIREVLNEGFEITWIANTSQCENCTKSGGRCGYDWKRYRFNCFCPDGAYSPNCNGTRVPGSFPSSTSALLSLVCGFQLTKAVQLEGLQGIPFPLLVNWKTTRSCP
ncbi:hypothetical protein BT93_B0661 [Corymbia citriodora subsp. variegata]|nr:hypothetical protein BT93_B0661 [Corymbia citriodora subsp. variegata]